MEQQPEPGHGHVVADQLLAQPLRVEQRPLQADERRDMASPLAFYVPYVTMMLLYATIMMAGSLLMNGITTEKQNRVLEILLGSVHPRELLAGKVPTTA